MLVIKNATIFTPEPLDHPLDLFIEAERITRMAPHGQVEPPANARLIDASGLQLVPGFIDLQLNGAFGHDFTAKPETIWPVSAELPRFGVTSYLPTIITSPPETVAAAQNVLLRQRPADFSGAEPLGLHVEGPFLNPQKKGAHNPAYLRRPDPDLITNWSASQGVSLVTLAPELPGALELVQQLVDRGVVVSAGHSMASFDEAQAGLRAGVRYGTHLFNAMPPLSHREPGLAGALLNDAHSVVGLIPDGIHVHPAMVKLAWAAKGSTGLNLVSDAMAALGMPPGRYQLNDFEVHVSKTDARLADGTLAGSILPLDEAVRNLIEYTGCSLSEALATVTTTPAALLGLSDQRGRIAPGLLADLVLLTPDLEVAMTISAGQITYKNQALETGI
ncbi:MAG: N-acetylglucosamine-6-phosphate deacetylase [Anaerolineae bacterium]|nr:N-acetylglucosamine-6-phosphate deacetylase [Anaerolineae bacterium]MCB9105153.1 N-acetylglucosamine-6-phosphate deacetylase [Anaerolineales bacterium]